MKNNVLETIIKNKSTCYFVSPHFDDAILSAGALMSYLCRYTQVVVINIFTQATDAPYTLSAKAYLKQCGYIDATKLFEDRRTEDKKVLRNVTKKIINLGFADALWRKKTTNNIFSKVFQGIAEFQVVYPTYKFHIIRGKIAKEDYNTINQIKRLIEKQISDKNSVVFCPLGIGSHVDHVIARKVCESFRGNLIYWSDFPYNKNEENETQMFNSFIFDQKLNEKKQLIQGYTTQYTAMFSKGLNIIEEKFYFK